MTAPKNDTPKIGDVRVIGRNDRWDVERYGDPADAADPNDPPEWVSCVGATAKRRPKPQPPITGA